MAMENHVVRVKVGIYYVLPQIQRPFGANMILHEGRKQ